LKKARRRGIKRNAGPLTFRLRGMSSAGLAADQLAFAGLP